MLGRYGTAGPIIEMRTEVLSLKVTENGGAQAILKIDLGKMDMEVFDNDFSMHPDKFEDDDCYQFGCDMIRCAFVGGWATFLARSLAKNLHLETVIPCLKNQLGVTGPDNAIIQDEASPS